jgi:UDP-2,4-diacetamido-2,4,6-trideoxy-beta-L-altropyranose hydrolase
VLVDHYRMAAPQERLLRSAGRKLVCIDDLASRPHACDLLVDPTLGRQPQAYAGLTGEGCTLLLGPEFALLRPGYAKARASTLARRQPQDPPRRLLVSLGLMDLRGITGRVMNLIRPALGELETDVVLGTGAQSRGWIEHLARENPLITLHVDARNVAKLIASADIGVGAGGASTWERAVLALPSLNLVLADNQAGLAQQLDQMGASIAIDTRDKSFAESLPSVFERLSSDAGLRTNLSRVSAGLCDGKGADRVAEAVSALLR